MSTSGGGDKSGIEVGAADGDVRFWKANEAIRQAELRLGNQMANLSAMEGRATSILGWAIAGITVLAAIVVAGPFRFAALVAAIFMFIAALASIFSLRTKDWGVVGYPPTFFLNDQHENQLEILESLALGYDETIIGNERILTNFSWTLTLAWIALALSPVMLCIFAYVSLAIS